MNSTFRQLRTLGFMVIISSGSSILMAQTNQTDAPRWLANAQIAPPFTPPRTKRVWEKKRKEIRAQLWAVLGKLPPRPGLAKVETLSREDKGDYFLEKFQFDN